jgi:hypothetical protein
VMAMRPMPYRHFEIGLNIIFNQKKQSWKN